MGFKLAAFADESSPRLSGQIDALVRNGFQHLEIRNIEGKNISDLTLTEAKEYAARLGDYGLSVRSLGSPIGKIPVDGDYEAHLDLYKHTLDLAAAFGADKIRLFSFYIPAGVDPASCRETVLRRMEDFVTLAKPYGVTACHENEKGIFGDTPERTRELLDALPQLGGIFDPANFIQCGAEILPAWELLKDRIHYLHVKDAMTDGTVVPAGYGCGQLETVVTDFLSRGGQVLTLEPHLSDFVGLHGLEQEGERTTLGSARFTYRDNNHSFDSAVQALKAILSRSGATPV